MKEPLYRASVALAASLLAGPVFAAPCDGVKLEGNYRWIALDGKDVDPQALESLTIIVARADGSAQVSDARANRGQAHLRVIGDACRWVLSRSGATEDAPDEMISYRVEYVSRQGDLVLSSEYGSVVLKRLP